MSGGEPQRRLVEHQELEPAPSGATKHLLLAAGERAGELPPPLLESREAAIDLVEARAHLGPPVDEVGADPQVVFRDSSKYPPSWYLHQPERYDGVRGAAGAAVELDRPLARRNEAGHGFQRRVLAAPWPRSA